MSAPDIAEIARGLMMESRTCEMCGVSFTPPSYRVARGHGKTCSRSCAARKAAKAFAETRVKPTDDEIIAFLWANVNIRGDDAYWPWLRTANVKGRGVLSYRGFRALAPRVAWRAKSGSWPSKDLFVCHSCDNPSCCNPAHLWLGTNRDNVRDMVAKGRAHQQNLALAHCKNGHDYTPENTYIDNRGRRGCKTCRLAATRRWNERRRSGHV